jgi:hypothetical protein
MRKWLVEIGGYLITDGSFGVSPGGRLSAGGHIFAFGVAPPAAAFLVIAGWTDAAVLRQCRARSTAGRGRLDFEATAHNDDGLGLAMN